MMKRLRKRALLVGISVVVLAPSLFAFPTAPSRDAVKRAPFSGVPKARFWKAFMTFEGRSSQTPRWYELMEALQWTYLALYEGEEDPLRELQLVVDTGMDFNLEKGPGGLTPLTATLFYYPHLEIVEFLLAKGADPNEIGFLGSLPLTMETWDVEITKALLKAGADPLLRDRDGNTPLHSAPSREIAKIYIDRGADVRAQNNFGTTVLISSAGSGSRELVEFFMDQGLDVKARDEYGKTALMTASGSGNLELVQFLMGQEGLSVHDKDSYGENLLHKATIEVDLELVKFLVGQGADVNDQDVYGQTPMHNLVQQYAFKQPHVVKEAMDTLLKEGADVSLKNEQEKTPRDVAQDRGYQELVDFLDFRKKNK